MISSAFIDPYVLIIANLEFSICFSIIDAAADARLIFLDNIRAHRGLFTNILLHFVFHAPYIVHAFSRASFYIYLYVFPL